MAFFKSEKIKADKKGSKLPILFLILVIIAAIVGGAVYANSKLDLVHLNAYSCYWDPSTYTKTFGPSPIPESKKVPIQIPTGLTFLEIGQKLKEAGLIQDEYSFACYVRKTDTGPKIQAGYFEVEVPINMENLVSSLQVAKIPVTRVTIREGLRADEIGKLIDTELSKENPIKAFDYDEFITLTTDKAFLDQYEYLKGRSSIEGFLFPDTYEFQKDADTLTVTKIMLSTFEKKVLNQLAAEFGKTNYSVYQIVTIASLLEREATNNLEEQRMVADIIERREQNGWFLDIDAAFLYEQKDWGHVITAKDKATNTPYNTYLRKGLPPTPISNPGVSTVRAALTPTPNQYWFYLHGLDGQIRYAVTYDQHVQNINKYLR